MRSIEKLKRDQFSIFEPKLFFGLDRYTLNNSLTFLAALSHVSTTKPLYSSSSEIKTKIRSNFTLSPTKQADNLSTFCTRILSPLSYSKGVALPPAFFYQIEKPKRLFTPPICVNEKQTAVLIAFFFPLPSTLAL
jgi:hypothetical protein